MNGLLIASLTSSKYKNIGDYIQSVAQEQYWDHIDCYVEREKLASFTTSSDEKVNVIMQGWFMWNADEFPPADCINPYFISFHLQPYVADKLLSSSRSVEYLKKYEPIGCRDLRTKELLEAKGIKCWFSGCLTLTLGMNYISPVKDDKVYIVDPYFEVGGSKTFSYPKRALIVLKECIVHLRQVLNLKTKYSAIKKYARGLKGWTLSMADAASLYHTYSKFFTDEILLGAEYLTHIIDVSGMSEDDKLDYARRLIRKYASAKLVISSRIHAVLPAMAVKTPAIFMNSDFLQNKGSTGIPAGRFGGLINLLNCITIDNPALSSTSIKRLLAKGKIGMDSQITNPTEYESVAEDLKAHTYLFVNKCKWGGEIAGSRTSWLLKQERKIVMMNRIKRLLSYNLLKTIAVNFRVFPLRTAVKLPLQIGWRVELINLYRGCIKLADGVSPHRYMIQIGITRYPMISTKSDYTLMRFADHSGAIIFGDNALIHNGVSLITSEGGGYYSGL